MSGHPPLDTGAVFSALAAAGVRFVVIGGMAGTIHGSPVTTWDIDICPARDRSNLEALATALAGLDATIRIDEIPEGLPFRCDADFLERMTMVNLRTRAGNVDVCFVPAGFAGFETLDEHAIDMTLFGTVTRVASLDDVITSKEQAGRTKDAAALPYLYALREVIASAPPDDHAEPDPTR